MKNTITILVTFLFTVSVLAQDFSCQFEELTAPDFIKAVKKSSKTCILPIGVLEKHGPHLPLGTDVYLAREYALRASKQDYTVVFPMYYTKITLK